ncbi:hypothetical protein WH96_20640 [Kiloniella spongiae]|uniref:Argininosuccinate lyase n=1 Tax=Kiloniella spongiae TaxID=1489064 RepID=A0A0H2M8P8_9PROT|nr:hypothetical protein [Kiloniella spongiae]KLN58879.1 hypothetical protein WH96_20640 [Kiloniella spongiae]
MKNCITTMAFTFSLLWATNSVAEDLEFLLVNESNSPVVAFYVSPSNSGVWESDLMEGGFLAPNYEIDVLIGDGLATCVYDIRADFKDGETVEDYGLDLCELGSYTFE